MRRNLLRSKKIGIVLIVLATLFSGLQNRSFGQAVGDYGSALAGPANWATANNWIVCITEGTWTGATVATVAPSNTTNVWIRSGHTITMNSNPGACKDLNIAGILTFTNTRTLAVSGNLLISGGTLSGNATGILNVAGTFSVPTSTSASIQRITITVTGTTSIAGTLNYETLATGTKTFVGLVTIQSSGSWINNTVNTPITFQGGITNNGIFTAGTGAHTFSVSSQDITGVLSIPSVTVTGITLTNNSDLTVGTALTGTGTLTNIGTLKIGGTSTITGLVATAAGNTVNYTGAAQTVKDISYGGNLIVSGSLSKTWTLAAARTIGGKLTISSGTLATTGNFTLGVTGETSVSGTLTLGGTAGKTFSGAVTVNSGGVWNNTGNSVTSFGDGITHNGTTFSNGTGAASFSATQSLLGSGNMTFGGSVTPATGTTLTNSNSGTVTINNIVLTGNFTQGLNNPTLALINVTPFSGAGTFDAGTNANTVNYAGTAQTARVTSYSNLTISNSGAKTFVTTPTVNGILSMEGTASVVVTTGVITYGANATLQYNKPAAYTATTEEWPATFSGTGGVIIKNTGVITFGAAKTITNNLSIAIGSSVNLGTFTTHAAGSLMFGGVSQSCGTWGYGTNKPPDNKNQTFFANNTGYITVGVFPVTYSVTGGGSVCSGGSGVDVGLDGSETGVDYQLYNGATAMGSSVAGTGSSISFGDQTSAGTYTVVATRTSGGCSATMTGSATVTVVPSVPDFSGTVTNTTCPASTDGAISITGLPTALAFSNSDDDYIDLGSNFLSGSTGRSQFTLEGWIKVDKSTIGNRIGLFGQNDAIEFGFINNTTIECWTPTAGAFDVSLSFYPNDNAWHHIAVTGNSTNMFMYIDGVQVAARGGVANYGSSTENVRIGASVFDAITTTTGGFTGQMLKVGFWSTALTSSQISNLASGFTSYTGSESGLLAGYNFYEGNGTALSSATSTGAGTLQNSPAWTDQFTYSWTKSGGYSASTKNINGLGVGTYNLAVSNGICTKSKSFDVNRDNTDLTASVSIAANPSGAVCAGTLVTFAASPTNGGSAPSYQWKLNGSNVGTNSVTYTNAALVNDNVVSCIMTSNATPCLINTQAISNEVKMMTTIPPAATFSYSGSPYCSNASNPNPTFSGGGVAGVFSSTAGLNFVSTSTGQINLATSTPGTYTVTNTIAASGGCAQVTATNTIIITAPPTATISYSGTPFCINISTAKPVTLNGSGAYSGGTYSSTSGLSIDSSTGAITPSTSAVGTYTVTYTIPPSGGCSSVDVTTSVAISALITTNAISIQ